MQAAYLTSIVCLALLPALARGSDAFAVADPPRTDPYGDPLPEGAVIRIGTARLRTVSNHIRPAFRHLLFSPDGKFVLSSAGTEEEVCLWEVATGREVRRFPSLSGRDELTFALSADGSLLAVWDGHVIRLYDTASGKEQRTLALSEETIVSPWLGLHFSRDGKALLLRHWKGSVGDDNGILRWDIATGKNIGKWNMGTEIPLAISADTRLVASTREKDRRIRLWETATGKKVREWEAGANIALEDGCLTFSPDGRHLVLADADSMIRVYEPATGKQVRSWKGRGPNENPARGNVLSDRAIVGGLVFAANGKILSSVDHDSNVLSLWDWQTGRELRRFPGVAGPVAFSSDGKIVAAAGEDCRLRLWETATGRDLCPFPDPDAIADLRFAPDGRTLAVGSDKPQVRLLDSASGRLLKRYPDYRSLSFSREGRDFLVQQRDESYCLVDAGTGKERFAVNGHFMGWVPAKNLWLTCDRGSIRVWDTATGKKLRDIGVAKERSKSIWAIAFSDARTVALVHQDAAVVHLVSLDSGKELRQLRGFSLHLFFQAERGSRGVGGGFFLTPDLSPNGKMLFAGINPDSFGLWDVTSGNWVARFRCGNFLPHQPVFSPNGDLLALLDTHGDPCLVDTATGRLRHRLTWKDGDLSWILESVRRFSADGRLLAAGYDAHTLVLWEVATGRPIRTWPGHDKGELRQMRFSPDGRRLATVGTDGTALVWDVTGLRPDGQLPAHKLTVAEREQAWHDLAGSDAAKAHRAIWSLVADPERALTLLRERLHAIPEMDERRLAQRIADLDSDDFKVRDTARRELRKHGELARSALREALTKRASPELGRTVRGLLDDLDNATLSAESLRQIRAVAVLEYLASGEARQLLGVLEGGSPEARQTQEAKASLARLRFGRSRAR